MPRKENLKGRRFNKLTVIEESGRNKWGYVLWECICQCGNKKKVASNHLKKGGVKSCGCLSPGNSFLPSYSSWAHMKQRVLNPKNDRSYRYGKLSMQADWIIFENFLRDMGSRPKGTSLDRIDNSKGYFKENCRWATPKQQQRNRASNRIVTAFGKTKCVQSWADDLNIRANTIIARLNRGWPVERALKEMCHQKNKS